MCSSNRTGAKIRQFQSELRNTRKGERSISEYLLRIKALIDSLLSIGDPVSIQEHVDVILDGLPEEYDGFITSITSRLEPYSVAKLESLLLLHEAYLERHSKAAISNAFSMNIAYIPPPVKPDPALDSSSVSSSHFVLPIAQDPPSQPAFPYGHNGHGHGRGRGGQNSKMCQVCFKPRHTASVCHHRFD